jgi:hypothetical protein
MPAQKQFYVVNGMVTNGNSVDWYSDDPITPPNMPMEMENQTTSFTITPLAAKPELTVTKIEVLLMCESRRISASGRNSQIIITLKSQILGM